MVGTCLVICLHPLLLPDVGRSVDDLAAEIDSALQRAVRFLLQRQHADGAWRSGTYAVLRDDLALTPLVLSTLCNLPQHTGAHQAALRRGVRVLMRPVTPDGDIALPPGAMGYPAYTASAAAWVIHHAGRSPEHHRARHAWRRYLQRRQLADALGWDPADPQYGGWGYAISLPRKPADAARVPTVGANLSATLFAIAALRADGVTQDDPLFKRILLFVTRCQNFEADPATRNPRLDDGGFFFSPTQPERNKAGIAGTDHHGRTRYRSYGSMTADGLRALVRCGLPFDDPRLRAARRWLEHNFSPAVNPGDFAPEREFLRDSYYYYYCWSVAHAFMALGTCKIETANGQVYWARHLAAELIRRQNRDGSWSNPCTDAKEDDPLVATPLAAAALTICRRMLAAPPQHASPAP